LGRYVLSVVGHGAGTVFEIKPNGKEKVIYSFAGGADGAGALEVIKKGHDLYGTTEYGGTASAGTVFEIDR